MKTKKCTLVWLAMLLVFLVIIVVNQPTLADQSSYIRTDTANMNANSTTTIRYVATDGTDSGSCASIPGRCRTLQYAIDAADPGDEIRVGAGTFAPGGIVAIITQAVRITGGYNSDFNNSDPELYETVLDAEGMGSVVYIQDAHSVTLKHLTLTNGDGSHNCGKDKGCGGGVYAWNSELFILQCRIVNNVGNSQGFEYGRGGGVYTISSDQQVQIWGSEISNNTANTSESAQSYSHGGGLYIQYGTAVLAQNRIFDNVASSVGAGGYGGGIYIYQVSQVEILENQLQDNKGCTSTLSPGAGGGMYLFFSNGYVIGNRIEGNWTNPNQAGDGGGVYISQSSVHLDRNTIIGNVTRPPETGWGTRGGGVHIAWSQSVILSNNLIALNQAYAGGGVYLSGSEVLPTSVDLVNNTLVDNHAAGVGVGEHATLNLTNNIIAGHSSGVINDYPATSLIEADTNLFWNNDEPITGSNAILADPLLTATYRLLPNSPAIDAGLTIPWLTVDLAGTPRPQGAVYDLGAFEMRCLRIFLPLAIKR